ncbi:MAG: methyltransferase domain-containing protein [Desulforhopalus sp.]|nr:methyltransferase domain-containing protein [Desulforhopalus sp.]
MEKIQATSRLSLLFSISWESDGTRHSERFFAEKVSMWRDLFPGSMHAELLGKQVGDTVQVKVLPADFIAPFSARLLRTVRRKQFALPRGIQPLLGRFYPQYSLQDVPGVFPTSIAPCRFVEEHGDNLVVDLNHPLAGKELTISATILRIEQPQVERGGRCEAWLETISAGGPGMQKRLPGKVLTFTEGAFARENERPDSLFYQSPRLLQHLDSTARRIIGEEYAKALPMSGDILDLMGSWDSHLPGDFPIGSLTVLGMNQEELDKNARATATVVHDLNADPRLPFADGSFGGILNTASIEYATDPQQLCREISRILRPGGTVAIAFSNRWFPTKAIALWSQLHEFERLGLVVDLLDAAGDFQNFTTLSVRGYPRPDDDTHDLALSDPVYMVTAKKKTDHH